MTEDIAAKLGPGNWDVIHTVASSIESEADEDKFIWMMHIICKKHKCGKCQTHCKEYIKNNPPSAYKGVKNDKGERIGMAKWSHIFHNAVNKRTGKKEISWDTFYSMYYSNAEAAVCTTTCGQEEKVQEPATSLKELSARSNLVTKVAKPTSGIRIVSRT